MDEHDKAAERHRPETPIGKGSRPQTERPRNDPGRATDAERRSGGGDGRTRHDPDRAHDAERRSDRTPNSRDDGAPR